MAHAMDELLNSNTLSEEVRSSISEAWDTQLTEAREKITAELREEFAQRYENDKSQIVEAADKMITDVVAKELVWDQEACYTSRPKGRWEQGRGS